MFSARTPLYPHPARYFAPHLPWEFSFFASLLHLSCRKTIFLACPQDVVFSFTQISARVFGYKVLKVAFVFHSIQSLHFISVIYGQIGCWWLKWITIQINYNFISLQQGNIQFAKHNLESSKILGAMRRTRHSDACINPPPTAYSSRGKLPIPIYFNVHLIHYSINLHFWSQIGNFNPLST